MDSIRGAPRIAIVAKHSSCRTAATARLLQTRPDSEIVSVTTSLHDVDEHADIILLSPSGFKPNEVRRHLHRSVWSAVIILMDSAAPVAPWIQAGASAAVEFSGQGSSQLGIAIDRAAAGRPQPPGHQVNALAAATAENAWDLHLAIDAHGRIRYASRAARRVIGRDPEQLIGQRLEDLVHPEDMADVRRSWGAIRLRPILYRIRSFGGSWIPVEACRTRIPGDDMVVESLRDRFADHAPALHEDASLEVDPRRQTVLNAWSHEIRTPLTPLRVHLALAQRHAEDPERVRQSVEMMRRQLERIMATLDELSSMGSAKIA